MDLKAPGMDDAGYIARVNGLLAAEKERTAQLTDQLTAVQARCTELLEEARVLRKTQSLNALRNECLRIAVEHGFKDASIPEDFALIHSEISEALEDYRSGEPVGYVWYNIGKPCGVPSEMADVIIRVLHFCGKHKIDIETAVKEKMAYNETRPFKHGKII